MNIAFMAKLRWDFERNKQKPWVALLSNKYKQLNQQTKRIIYSYIYKILFKVKNIFKLNTFHIVKNGRNTNLWSDRWINNMPLQNQLIGPLPLGEHEKTLSSITSHSNGTHY